MRPRLKRNVTIVLLGAVSLVSMWGYNLWFGHKLKLEVMVEDKELQSTHDLTPKLRIDILPGRRSWEPYALETPDTIDISGGRAKLIIEVFRRSGLEGHTFLEYGGGDGETRSISLELERTSNWTGLVMEPKRTLFEKLRSKNRKCKILHACLQHENKTKELSMAHAVIPCYQFDELLDEGFKQPVDLLIISSTGNELSILKTISFEKYNIQVISVEFSETNFEAKSDAVSQYLARLGHGGYSAQHHISTFYKPTSDIVYRKFQPPPSDFN